jgi:hypothetical protein
MLTESQEVNSQGASKGRNTVGRSFCQDSWGDATTLIQLQSQGLLRGISSQHMYLHEAGLPSSRQRVAGLGFWNMRRIGLSSILPSDETESDIKLI